MNRKELIGVIAMKTGMTRKETTMFVNAFLSTVTETLCKREKVQLSPFGSFEVRERDAREGRNPRTGDVIEIPAKSVPVFRPGKALKSAVEEVAKKM